ncbi:MAG: aldo/keto reductase [Gammaproteobacteria bacterium]|nr:aldo/keto reductase [Gammaproteobacteria bacterium]
MKKMTGISRRQFLELTIGLTGSLAAGLMLPKPVLANTAALRKAIPKTGEMLPLIGMGTSRTFDASANTELLTRLLEVTQTFFDMGGGMIDSSPMYGSSQEVIGQLLPRINAKKNLFSATKVWIEGKEAGIQQMEESRQQWGIQHFDLMQVHNLVDWETQLETLKQMKADGKIRYTGITTSHGRYHSRLVDILKQHDFDFLQLSYNIGNRDVESSLLPIAEEKGIAVIVNRPYQRGELFRHVKGKPLPDWAKEFNCHSWGQYFLKYVVSHPAVNCAIPATTKVKHMKDNMQAGRGVLPGAKQRIQMLKYFESL